MKRIPIATAKEVADKHDLKQVLLIGWDGDRTHVVTYGKTKVDCEQAAKAQEFWLGHIRTLSFSSFNVDQLLCMRVALEGFIKQMAASKDLYSLRYCDIASRLLQEIADDKITGDET